MNECASQKRVSNGKARVERGMVVIVGEKRGAMACGGVGHCRSIACHGVWGLGRRAVSSSQQAWPDWAGYWAGLS